MNHLLLLTAMAVLLTIGFMIVIWRLDRIARTSERLRDWYKIPNRQVYCQSFRIWLQNVVRIHIRNRIRRPAIPSLLILLIVTFIACVPLSGCGTTAQRATFQTASGTAVTVEVGLAAYNQFAKAGKTTLDQNLKVKDAFEKYKLAMATACDAGAIYAASNTTNAPAAAAYQQALLNGSKSITDFLNLVQSFGVKLTN